MNRCIQAAYSHIRRTALAASAMIITSELPAAAASGQASAVEKAARSITQGAIVQTPPWLTDLSLGVKAGYDDNVFLVSGQGAKEVSSWVGTVSPKIGFNLTHLFREQDKIQLFAVGYAPDIASYRDATSENHAIHRLTTAIKGKSGRISFSADNLVTYVDGSEDAPIYSPATRDDQRSAYATSAARERRKQFQDRAKVVVQYDLDGLFVRSTATLLYYDLLTDLKTTPGYQNYSDRYDVNGGADIGKKVSSNYVVYVGYRRGHQSQQQFSKAIDATQASATSDYQRVLVGLDGKVLKWLHMSIQAGPDFRKYRQDSETHFTPLSEKSPVEFYGEAMVTATPSSKDGISLKYKQWQWLSSTGKIAMYDSSYDLSYRRTLANNFSLEIGGKAANSDYTNGLGNSCKRNDWMYSLSSNLTCAVTARLRASLGYTRDMGRNSLDSLAPGQIEQFREFDRHQFSFSAILKL